MKQFLSFVKKEFLHILRDKRTLFILLGMPIVQIIIFGFALTNEVKNEGIAVLDLAKDQSSGELIRQMDASRYFELRAYLQNEQQIEKTFLKGQIKLAVVIPPGFDHQLRHTNKAQLQLIADASDPNLANTMVNYAGSIVQQFQSTIFPQQQAAYQIQTELRMLYNPQLKGAYNFVPGVMAMVLLLVCTMMTAITIVKEKESGTMEIMLVSPLVPFSITLAKAVPYLLLSIVNIISILLLSVYVLDVPIRGSVLLLIGMSILFTMVSLSLGLLISARSSSQQTAMFISLVGMFLPTVMFSGFMFPIENMPKPLQVISNIVPAKWYYIIVKSVMIKGVGFNAIWKEALILAGMCTFFLAMAIRNFKIRLA
ncbi:ABC transporter permease [Sediminibacterium goheungense]|uniref:ABC-2 type transport system permease protein n=1 Tax=Sediminibacterium goheungense TaxID=1086393 RepID=A0A4R6ITD0_9BACT|nr:ABC transporter permease [Sediminibacterium goheungense]TDO25165.1 ABC-2 type transport system permease protein [Sediminibacterium goheungense]